MKKLWLHPTPGEHDLNKLKSTLTENVSTQVTAFLANQLQRRFLNLFYIFLCKNLTPHCALTLPPGIMICATLNLHYLRILPNK